MPTTHWDDRYAAGDLPWDTGEPDEHLVQFVRAAGIGRGRALEVGCGTGTNALWLAEQGFDVLGLDVSPIAITKARARLGGAVTSFRFSVLDFLSGELPSGPFQLVFDRGCFHVFDEAEERARFAQRVAQVLAPAGVWLSLIGSTEGAAREVGPPRRSARDVIAAVEPALELRELRAVAFRTQGPSAPAWLCVARRRELPAQPSTGRSRAGAER